jgi:hypothetical protein
MMTETPTQQVPGDIVGYQVEVRRTRPHRETTRRQAARALPRYWSATLDRYVTIPED